jgi:hypothetical protein
LCKKRETPSEKQSEKQKGWDCGSGEGGQAQAIFGGILVVRTSLHSFCFF